MALASPCSQGGRSPAIIFEATAGVGYGDDELESVLASVTPEERQSFKDILANEVISPAGSVTTPDFAAPVEQEVEQEVAIASVDAVHHSSPYVGDCRLETPDGRARSTTLYAPCVVGSTTDGRYRCLPVVLDDGSPISIVDPGVEGGWVCIHICPGGVGGEAAKSVDPEQKHARCIGAELLANDELELE